MADALASVGKTDEHTRATTMRELKRLRKIREEEDEAAKELLEEVQDRKQQLEDEAWKEMEDCFVSWDPLASFGFAPSGGLVGWRHRRGGGA